MNLKVLIISAVIFNLCLSLAAFGQKEAIEQTLDRKEAVAHLRFLASDELRGRDALRPEIDIAARYIADQFWKYGAKELEGLDGFYQDVPFQAVSLPRLGKITFGDSSFIHGEDMVMLEGADIEGSFPLVLAGYGMEEDLNSLDLKGKVVVAKIGAPGLNDPSKIIALGKEKRTLAHKKGAAGLIELVNLPEVHWRSLANYLNRPKLSIDLNPDEPSAGIPHAYVSDPSNNILSGIDANKITQAGLEIVGMQSRKIRGRNVVAYIEGSDPNLKDEFLMLSAHYDHIGVGEPNAQGDSIYNGARDNAVGTVALINAAKYFSLHPPKRSLLLCAWTAEEKGLLGSAYFADNPPLPLDQIIYNLNIDNAGYNDTSIVTVIGLGRTSGDEMIEKAAAEFGIRAVPDPAPEQGLYDRSDNVNFARKGIPSPTFSLGFNAFDEEIMKYYHQAADQVDNFDLDYAMVYWKSYLLSASHIANADFRPRWVSGDKYEEAALQLYGD